MSCTVRRLPLNFAAEMLAGRMCRNWEDAGKCPESFFWSFVSTLARRIATKSVLALSEMTGNLVEVALDVDKITCTAHLFLQSCKWPDCLPGSGESPWRLC